MILSQVFFGPVLHETQNEWFWGLSYLHGLPLGCLGVTEVPLLGSTYQSESINSHNRESSLSEGD